jgi:hypothetical protein
MQKDISFYSERLGRQITGTWSLFGGKLTVTACDGRQKTTLLGDSSPESLARLMLVELEVQMAGK